MALREEIRAGSVSYDEKSMQERVYEIAEEARSRQEANLRAMYQVLIGKERGPRLGGFLLTIGRDRLLQILERY